MFFHVSVANVCRVWYNFDWHNEVFTHAHNSNPAERFFVCPLFSSALLWFRRSDLLAYVRVCVGVSDGTHNGEIFT